MAFLLWQDSLMTAAFLQVRQSVGQTDRPVKWTVVACGWTRISGLKSLINFMSHQREREGEAIKMGHFIAPGLRKCLLFLLTDGSWETLDKSGIESESANKILINHIQVIVNFNAPFCAIREGNLKWQCKFTQYKQIKFVFLGRKKISSVCRVARAAVAAVEELCRSGRLLRRASIKVTIKWDPE